MFRYAHHLIFRFVVNSFIYRRKAALGYNLLIKLGIWEKTEESIYKIIYTQLITIVTKIKKINWCTNVAILVLKRYIKTIAAYAAYVYA